MHQTYKVGSVVMTQQAFLVFLAGTTLSVILFSIGLYAAITPKYALATIPLMIFSLLMFGLTCYQTYVTNCIIVGKCKKLAWFFVVTWFLGMIINAISAWKTWSSMKQLSSGFNPSPSPSSSLSSKSASKRSVKGKSSNKK